MSETKLAPQSLGAVRKAREALRGKSQELLDEFRAMIRQAAEKGEWEAALKAQQWLVDHAPADDDGERLIGPSVDKQQVIDSGPKAPMVTVGIQLGGLDLPKQVGSSKTPAAEQNE